VIWPEKIRMGSSRAARFRYFDEAVFRPRGIDPLEADVDPVQRFLIENPTYRLEDTPRLLYIDIETERITDWETPWNDRILSVSWRSAEGGGHFRAPSLTDEGERVMLAQLKSVMDRHDIVLAWNGSRFDFPMVKSRMAILNVPFDPSIYHWLDHLQIFKRSYQSTDGDSLSSHALDHVGFHVLGRRKVKLEERAREIGWNGQGDLMVRCWEHAPELLREYNDADVDLMVEIEAKTQLVYLHLSLCRLCRVLPDEWSQYPSKLIDGRLFQRGHAAGYHFPSKRKVEEQQYGGAARGAFVPEAVVGLHDSVAVVDYARMYPSIILTFNMSLETLDPDGDLRVPDTDLQGQLTGGLVARFRSAPEGHLPVAIRGVLKERKQYEQRRAGLEVGSPAWRDADTLSMACKVLANSFYGVLLSPYSRYFEPKLGESVTSVGRLLLANTMAEVKARGHKFIFGDTDSNAFVATDEQAKAIQDVVNQEMIPRVLAPTGARPGEIAIDYEKRFARVLVTASKKYAGRFAVYKGKPAKLDAPLAIKGLEMIRSDVCPAARSLQRLAIEMVLDGEPPAALSQMVEAARADVLEGKVDASKLVLRKALTKDVDQYETKPIQVKVAEKMLSEGMQADAGSKIPYLLTRAGPVHPSALKDESELDLKTYWDSQIYPATQRCLEAAYPDAGWDRLLLPRNYNPDQPDLFGRIPIRPSEPENARSRPTRAVRPPATQAIVAPRVVIRMVEPSSEDRAADLAKRLHLLIQAFPGDTPVTLWISVQRPGGSDRVEVDLTLRAARPDEEPRLAAGLRALGLTWG
jgi:DNA polymerase elongation subunit (family B)